MSTTAPDIGGGPDVNEVLKEPLKLAIFDISGSTLEMARDFGDRRAAETLTDPNLGRFRGTLKKIWHTQFDQFYREHGKHKGLEQIVESGNIFAAEDGNLSSDAAMAALIKRATSDIEGAVSEQAGEKRLLIDSTPEGEALKDGVWDMVQHAISEGLSREDFEEYAKGNIRAMSDKHPDLFGQGVMYATNLWDIKETVQFATEHGDSIDRIRQDAQIFVGEANMGLRGEAHRNVVDRTLDKINDKDLELISRGVIKASTATALIAGTVGVAKFVSTKTASVAVGLTGAVGAVAGARGYLKERRRLNIDRKRDMREAAAGKHESYPDPETIDTSTRKGKRLKKQIIKSIERREAIKSTRYETVSATDQTEKLKSYVDAENNILDVSTLEQYDEAMIELALAKVAEDMSNTRSIDLVGYSALDKVDEERWDLMMARATLSARLEENYDTFHPADPANPDAASSFEADLASHMAAFEAMVGDDISDKDKTFRKLRRWKAVRAGGSGAALGLLIGASLQEAAAHGQDGMNIPSSGEIDALGEGQIESGDSETLSRGIFDSFSDSDADGSATVESDGSAAGDVATGNPVGEPGGQEAGTGDTTGPEVDGGTSTPDGGAPIDVSPESNDGGSTLTLLPPESGTETTTVGVGESTLTRLELPDGLRLDEIHGEADVDAYNIVADVNGTESTVGTIVLDQNGQITAESLEALKALGVEDSFTEVPIEGLSGEYRSVPLEGSNQVINIPAEYHGNNLGEGRVEILNSQGASVGEIQVDSNGVLIESTVEETSGINVEVATEVINGGDQAVEMSVQEYLDSHETTSVSRELYYGNNTQISDNAELQLHAGGINGSWNAENGDVVIDVTGMMDSEVFQGGESANVVELIGQGNLKASVTLGEGSQAETFLYDIAIGEDGRALAVIDSDDGIASLFGQTESGQRTFDGAYIEIFEMRGDHAANGAENVRVLSTFVGENNANSITEVVPISNEVTTIDLSVTDATLESHTLTFGEVSLDASEVAETAESVTDTVDQVIDQATEVVADSSDELAGVADAAAEIADDVQATAEAVVDEAQAGSEVVADEARSFVERVRAAASETGGGQGEINPIYYMPPIYARTGMARMSNTERAEQGNVGGPEVARTRWSDRSPRLIENAQAKLELGQEVSWYQTRLRQKKGEQYVDDLAEKIENDTYGAEFIDNGVNAVITLPLNAIEVSDNIYEILSMYEQQSDRNGSVSSIFLQLEWSESDLADPEKRAKLDKTRLEIQRIFNDTDIRLTVIEKQWPDLDMASATHETQSRQHMVDALMIAIGKQIDSGNLDADRDLMIVAQSAKVVGIQKTFIQKIMKAVRDKPSADVFIGQNREVTESYNEYPGLNAVTNLKTVLEWLTTHNGNDNVSTTNTTATAVRASTLAAVGGIGFDDQIDAGEELGFRVNAARDARNPEPTSIYEVISNGAEVPSGEVAGEFDNGKPIQFAQGANVEVSDQDFIQDYLSAGKIVVAGQNFEAENLLDNASAELMYERYEHAVSEMLTKQFRSPGEAALALAMTLGAKNGAGADTYELTWVDGVAHFKLTQPGKNRLRRSLRGQINRDQQKRVKGTRATLRRAA